MLAWTWTWTWTRKAIPNNVSTMSEKIMHALDLEHLTSNLNFSFTPFCHAENFMLWDTYVDVANPSGKLKDLHKDIQYVTLGKLPLK